MKTEIMIAVLGIICIGSLAAAFVLWAKLDEQKQKTKDEHANYIAALRIGKINAEYSQRLQEQIEQGKLREKCQAQSVLWFADQLKYWKQANDDKTRSIQFCHAEYAKLRDERDALQDFKSSKLCPHNDHIWKDGRCAKCGRVQE